MRILQSTEGHASSDTRKVCLSVSAAQNELFSRIIEHSRRIEREPLSRKRDILLSVTTETKRDLLLSTCVQQKTKHKVILAREWLADNTLLWWPVSGWLVPTNGLLWPANRFSSPGGECTWPHSVSSLNVKWCEIAPGLVKYVSGSFTEPELVGQERIQHRRP